MFEPTSPRIANGIANVWGLSSAQRRALCSLTKLLLSTWRGVSGHFFFDVLRFALLRPSYRGRRAGVDSFRFLRLLMGWSSLCFQALNDIGHGGFRLGRDHQTIIRKLDHENARRAHAGVAPMLEGNEGPL